MDAAIKHPLPCRPIKPSFVILYIRRPDDLQQNEHDSAVNTEQTPRHLCN